MVFPRFLTPHRPKNTTSRDPYPPSSRDPPFRHDPPPPAPLWEGQGARGPGSRGGPGPWLSGTVSGLGVRIPRARSPQRGRDPLSLLFKGGNNPQWPLNGVGRISPDSSQILLFRLSGYALYPRKHNVMICRNLGGLLFGAKPQKHQGFFSTYPDLPILAFFVFLAFFCFPVFLAFLCVFALLSKDFKGSAERKKSLPSSGIPAFFFACQKAKIGGSGYKPLKSEGFKCGMGWVVVQEQPFLNWRALCCAGCFAEQSIFRRGRKGQRDAGKKGFKVTESSLSWPRFLRGSALQRQRPRCIDQQHEDTTKMTNAVLSVSAKIRKTREGSL